MGKAQDPTVGWLCEGAGSHSRWAEPPGTSQEGVRAGTMEQFLTTPDQCVFNDSIVCSRNETVAVQGQHIRPRMIKTRSLGMSSNASNELTRHLMMVKLLPCLM